MQAVVPLVDPLPRAACMASGAPGCAGGGCPRRARWHHATPAGFFCTSTSSATKGRSSGGQLQLLGQRGTEGWVNSGGRLEPGRWRTASSFGLQFVATQRVRCARRVTASSAPACSVACWACSCCMAVARCWCWASTCALSGPLASKPRFNPRFRSSSVAVGQVVLLLRHHGLLGQQSAAPALGCRHHPRAGRPVQVLFVARAWSSAVRAVAACLLRWVSVACSSVQRAVTTAGPLGGKPVRQGGVQQAHGARRRCSCCSSQRHVAQRQQGHILAVGQLQLGVDGGQLVKAGGHLQCVVKGRCGRPAPAREKSRRCC
jgi:hypothetical protein